MGQIDLSSVLAQATQETKEAVESSGDSYKLVYPQTGEMTVRLIYNNQSGILMRKFERHTINGHKITCLSNFDNQECPVCKAINNIKNVTGSDLWQLKRKTRGIAYAEYIASNYKWSDPKYEPKSREIVLLMFPWTVYQDFNRLISSAGQNIYSLIGSNVGGVFKISCWTENNQIKYRVDIDPFNQSHQTCDTDDEYNKLMMTLPSLNEKFVPLTITDEIINAANAAADEITQEYLGTRTVKPELGSSGTNLAQAVQPQVAPAVSAPAPVSTPQTYEDPVTHMKYININGQWVLQQPMTPPPIMNPPINPVPTPVPAPVQQSAPIPNANTPACFGKYGDPTIDPNTCLLCPHQGPCMQNVGKL
jgi:hypothetical protein